MSAFQTGTNNEKIQDNIIKSKAFSKIYQLDIPIIKEMILPSQTEEEKIENYIVLNDRYI